MSTPLGRSWVLGVKEEAIAIYPVHPNVKTNLNNVLGFDSEEDAKGWIKEMSDINAESAKLLERVKAMKADQI